MLVISEDSGKKKRIFKSWPFCSPHRWMNKKEKENLGDLGINRGVGFSQLWNRYARLLTAGREISPRSSLFLGKTERTTEIEPRNRLSPNFKILTFKLRWIANTLYVKMSVTHCKRIKKYFMSKSSHFTLDWKGPYGNSEVNKRSWARNTS